MNAPRPEPRTMVNEGGFLSMTTFSLVLPSRLGLPLLPWQGLPVPAPPPGVHGAPGVSLSVVACAAGARARAASAATVAVSARIERSRLTRGPPSQSLG